MTQLTRRDFLRLCGTSSIGLALAACGVTPTPTTTPASTNTPLPPNTTLPIAIPTGTATPTLTNTPTPTSTATITVRPQTLAEWAKVSIPDAKLLQSVTTAYAKAMAIDASTIRTTTKIVQRPDRIFAKIIDQQTGIALFLSAADENGYLWKEAMPGNYWDAYGKTAGLHVNGPQWAANKQIITKYFCQGGTLSLQGQVRAGPDIDERRPSNAAEYIRAVQQNDMGFIFSNIVEPARFPKESNKDNVDQWLERRLSETVAVIQQNKPRRPVLLQFNQAFAFDKPEVRWNPGRNPLKDKYGEQWLGEYFYKALNVPISKGWNPNVDFITLINDNLDKHRYNEATLRFVHDKIAEARRYAFAKLLSDESIARKLNGMGIKRPEDINIIFGSQTYVNLDNRPSSGVNFIGDPTKEQIDHLANNFGDMGGILLTEIAPFGNIQQKAEFIRKITRAAINNPNIRGAILWNIFNNPPADPNDPFMQSPTPLFNPDGTQSQLYYMLLSGED